MRGKLVISILFPRVATEATSPPASVALSSCRSDGGASDGSAEMSAIFSEFGRMQLQVCLLSDSVFFLGKVLIPLAPGCAHLQVQTVGFGPCPDSACLSRLAALGGGTYKACLAGADLVQAFKELAASPTLQVCSSCVCPDAQTIVVVCGMLSFPCAPLSLLLLLVGYQTKLIGKFGDRIAELVSNRLCLDYL